MRVVFFGSGAFGIPTLEALVAAHEVALVVSQPDRPAGRGKVLTATPLAARAVELGLPVMKPQDVNERASRDAIRALGASAWVVIAFGQKLSRELLDGVFAINLHGSLLPAYRGAAPIQRAVMDGCIETGVSVISLAERMDAGLVYATARCPIEPRATSDEVHDQLSLLGPAVIESVLAQHAAGTLVGAQQDESKATRARKLLKAEATIDLAGMDARTARARINGLNSWPGCTVLIGDVAVKLLRVEEVASDRAVHAAPGIFESGGVIATRSGAIQVIEIQPIGKRAMPIAEFLSGRAQLRGCPVKPMPAAAESH
ncbi:MAG: methionyl-tRNA formyltransferase [Limnohabitans sp.]|jgi:methionyl-tRNA formyltransferase|nr:methionyl-tRNA formyltransferase [Limnohabitans sp.]